MLRHLALPRLRPVTYFGKPDPATGRIQHFAYLVTPYYQAATAWNRWGPMAWLSRAACWRLPGDGGAAWLPGGFLYEDVGPVARMGKGQEAAALIEEKLRAERPRGCPFA